MASRLSPAMPHYCNNPKQNRARQREGKTQLITSTLVKQLITHRTIPSISTSHISLNDHITIGSPTSPPGEGGRRTVQLSKSVLHRWRIRNPAPPHPVLPLRFTDTHSKTATVLTHKSIYDIIT